MVTKIVRLKIK